MTVYVDSANIEASVKSGSRTHTSRWCHMMADTRVELDAMAVRLGLRTSYRQKSGTWQEHYDLTAPKRAQALRYGAVEKDSYELVNWALEHSNRTS